MPLENKLTNRPTHRGLEENPTAIAQHWQLRTQSLHFGRIPKLMAIVNVTPDSFSDGGKFRDPDAAIDHALHLDEEGADILDIGGESTRPYSTAVEPAEELRRVIRVIEGIKRQTETPISIDTSKAVVAQAAIDAGAEIINDVTGFVDSDMIQLAVSTGSGICAMHMQGTPQTMQDNPTYANPVKDILQFLRARKMTLLTAGIEPDKICLDPGIGFGKTHAHNVELVAHCRRFHELGCPVLFGHSRKGFIGKIIGDQQADRDAGTLGVTLFLATQGIQVIRVHEISNTRQALLAFAAVGGN